MLRVLSVASELYPLVKTGGLADVAGALPIALAREGVAMRSIIPGYRPVMEKLDGAAVVHRDHALFGGPAQLLAARVAGLDVLVLDAPHLYARDGIYAGAHGDFADNPFRFAALARVAAQIGQGLLPDWLPDVVHAHDWQAGLAPAYLHYDALVWGSRRPATVFTVHNLAFQGLAAPELLPALGLPDFAFSIDGVEQGGAIGFLKAGLRLADHVTTVSPSYAAEICTPEQGMGLDGLLRARGAALSGILNGIDTEVWNPATDRALPARFSAGDCSARAENKAALQRRMAIDADPDLMLFGVVSRLSWQKGLDLLLAALPDVIAAGGQVVLLGAGDRDLDAGFHRAAAQYPGRVGLYIGYEENLAHLVQAGSDALVVPSRFEPCGLTQLCALRYGAVPIVTRVGGLADTVIDANEAALAAGAATGFLCAPDGPAALAAAIWRAARLWRQDRAGWARMQRAGMQSDLGWQGPARRYAALYEAVIR